jgi:hypothetical protein
VRVNFISGTSRPKPKAGDTRTVKGIPQVRVLKYVHDRQGNRIGLDCTGGRQRYEWQPVTAPEASNGNG